jgi:hypothetical protein
VGVHAGVYVIVNAALFVVNMITSRDALWFYWPLLGWGIGLAIHAFVVLSGGKFFGEEWEDRKARELMRRDNDRRSATS